MPNSRHREAMLSPSLSRITKRILSSITELSFHGIPSLPPPYRGKSVTHVSGTFCYLCLGTVINSLPPLSSMRRTVHLSCLAPFLTGLSQRPVFHPFASRPYE